MNEGAYVEPTRLEPIPPESELDLGRVITRTLSAWSCNLLPFTLVAAVVYAPILIYGFWVLSGPLQLEEVGRATLLMLFGPLMLEPIVAGLIARAVLNHHHGKPAAVLDALRDGGRAIVPLIGVTLLVGFAVAAGTFALLVPGAIVYIAFFVAGPAVAIERDGVTNALNRSFALTRGHRLKLFGLLLLVCAVIYYGYKWLGSQTYIGQTAEDIKLYIALSYLLTINVVTLRAVLRAVCYVELTGGAVPPAK